MSEFVSFPRAGIEDHERSSSIYNKMFSAASHMFQSLKDSDFVDISRKTSPPASGAKSSASSHKSTISVPSLPMAIPSTATSDTNAIEYSQPESRSQMQVETGKSDVGKKADQQVNPAPNSSQPSVRASKLSSSPAKPQITAANGGSAGSRSNSIVKSAHTSVSIPAPMRSELSKSLARNKRPDIHIQDRPQFLRTSTTSSATVGLSAEQAVPHLPTANLASSSSSSSSSTAVGSISDRATMRSRSLSVGTQRSVSTQSVRSGVDRESMFSVNSTSASRAYWASQYSRTRSRAAPGRLSREFWMKDESATSCFSCNRAFTTFRRKHHCRVCGQIFCSTCTDLIDGAICGAPNRRVRCCKACEDSLAQHTSSDDEAEMSFWSQAPQDDAKWPEIPGSDESPASGDILGSISHGRSHSFSSVSDHGIHSNSTSHNRHGNPEDDAADGYGARESYSRLASPVVPDEQMFARSFLGPSHHYQGRTRPRSHSQMSRDDDLYTGSSSVHLGTPASTNHTINSPPGATSTLGTTPSSHGHAASSLSLVGYTGGGGGSSHAINSIPAHMHSEEPHNFPSSNALFPNSATVELNNATISYLTLFLDQLLKDSELDPEQWASVLMAPILELASGLHLELNDKVSPREWVKIKRIPGGEPHDIDYINGIAFTHSLARKSMPTQISTPRILLITFPIEYARNERYVSLEPIVAQEREYLKKLVARIIALRPNILLTSSHVSGIALSMLESDGVAVAQNVKESALFRLSRITRADILTSIDRLSVAPQLGTCELFEQRSYRYKHFVKTFLFFFVRPADPGRCALVRGDPEISGVIKVVLEVMAEICYSLKAETALMRDQFVTVPNLTEPPAIILSSSPFVDYGAPFLQKKTRELEDKVVELGNQLDVETSKEVRYLLTRRLEFVRQKWMETSKIWESIENAYPFMFNPSSHQNLIILYSLVCTETATPCVGPDSQLVEFYLSTDQTLGKFVETNISQANDSCPDGCNRPMSAHYKSYVNGNGMVTVKTEKLPCKVPGLEASILMWSYCNICEQQMPIVPMSSTTWKCSVGKYLELSFYGEPLRMRASTCTHNVYRDHTRYFGWHGYALKIEYANVELNEITGPSRVLRWNPQAEIDMKHNAYQEWLKKLKRFWSSLIETLGQVKIEGLEDAMIELSQQKLKELRSKAEADSEESIAVLTNLFNETEPYDYLSLNKFLENYQQLVDQWHSDIADFDGQFFPTERDIRRVTAQHIRGLIGDEQSKPRYSRRGSSTTISSRHEDSSDEKGDNEMKIDPSSVPPLPNDANSVKLGSENHQLDVSTASCNPDHTLVEGDSIRDGEASQAPSVDAVSSSASKSDPTVESNEPMALDKKSKNAKDNEPENLSPIKKFSSGQIMSPKNQALSPISLPPSNRLRYRGIPTKSPDNNGTSKIGSPSSVKVKSRFGNDINVSMPSISQTSLSQGGNRVTILAEHFEELSREFERERIREESRIRERQRAIRQRHAHPVAEVFEDVTDAIEDWPQQNPQTQSEVAGNDSPDKITETTDNSAAVETSNDSMLSTHPLSDDISDSRRAESNQVDGAETTSYEESKPNGLEENAVTGSKIDESAVQDEEYKRSEPTRLSLIHTLANFWAERSSSRWNGIEYVLQPKEHFFTNSPVVIRDNEPSSLIAFCLSLPDYLSRIQDFYKVTTGTNALTAITENRVKSEESNAILEQAMLRQTGTHMRYHFERNTVKVSCKIFFSEQFDALRRKCHVTDKFIQSLSRCNPWESTGGKSGSSFLKTLDDRLILKELNHGEFDSFVNFAPSYFEYMSQALFHDLPTVLSKIFGVYQITIRNTSTSQQVKMYVLVMENLFYGSRFSKVFDLKGSMRNRKVTETGRENEVLLDENMVEYIYESPVFVREQSKRMLRTSLYNDTLFLTKMNVMDYSLIVGLDEEHNVIVAGIIDYIRTYTWDKKIESWVKTRAPTGSFKEPTVVSPKQYKGRFRESMERYFVMVPDCWSQPGSA